MRRSPLVFGALAIAALSGFAMCRDATQMFVEISTDAPCTSAQALTTTVVIGKLGALGSKAPATLSSTCRDGKIGTLVIVPSGSDDDELAFEVTTGIGVDPSSGACSDTASPQCIVARRALRFRPHESLRIRVPMRLACAGHPCDPFSTCKAGSCAPATIGDPSACTGDGCGEEALGTGGASPNDGGDAGDAGQTDGGDAGAPAIQLALGQQHSCALVDGGVWCWGTGSELGLGDSVTFALTPTAVPGMSSARSTSRGALSGAGATTGPAWRSARHRPSIFSARPTRSGAVSTSRRSS